MSPRYQFNRLEFAGALGDMGTLLPLSIGLILINGLHPGGIFFSVGLYYILSGHYFGLTTPVQPMKVISAYAIATAMSAPQILASGLMMGILMLVIGATGAIDVIGRYTPRSVVRGIQLSTGTVLMTQGIRFMLGTAKIQMIQQAAEPYLSIQRLGPVPIGVIIGVIGGLITLLLLNNKRVPAGLVIVLGGLGLGLMFGTREGLEQLRIGWHWPEWMPFGWPAQIDFTFALFALVLPQLPMTIGNAVIADADLAREYFGDRSARVTHRALSVSMGLANVGSFLVGGMPLCHGAGGLAAQYRFGARTAGSNLIIGTIFLVLALFLGIHALPVLYLMPMAVLGVLLLFAGGQLALTITDLTTRRDMFVAVTMLGITLASNLAYGFVVGLVVAYGLKSEKLSI